MLLFDTSTEAGLEALANYERTTKDKGQRIYARIKRSSKYYGQSAPKEIFPVFIYPGYGDYVVQGGPGGQYRLCDVNLFVVGGFEPSQLHRIS